MTRAEFKKETKRQALKRAKNQCEAVGTWYGLPEGQRCGNNFGRGVNFDHIILEANSHDNSLENCAAVCIPCHEYKTSKRDIPLAAKTVRQQDKDSGIVRPRGFRKPEGFKYSWKTGRMERVT